MVRLTRDDQLSFASLAEIREGVERLLTTARYVWRLRCHGGKLQQNHMLNAIMLQFLALDPAHQRDFLAAGLDLLDARLDTDAEPSPMPPIGAVEHRKLPDARDDPAAPRRVVG